MNTQYEKWECISDLTLTTSPLKLPINPVEAPTEISYRNK